ncbi:hypothetical protein AAFC00_005223 [Neodothiora populina]|uniref:t-SNARE coiled-coil homology domain-containing protein n=1 Tax=Neodothiora populina TaxID=2781224 RepID=A0ABR3PKE6_9PEZI
MASRFHQQRDAASSAAAARSSLFSGYDQQQTRSRPTSVSPAPPSSFRASPANSGLHNPSFGAYPGQASSGYGVSGGSSYANGGYGAGGREPGGGQVRSATPNSRGQYSDAVLSGLESQNDEQVSVLSGKVAMLKDITLRIGDEIRDSTAFAEKMNDQFGNTSARLKGTMNRMLRMAERTGVGWKVWLGFFAAVIVLFCYVWLF